MKRRTLNIFILLALISVLGIVITQIYWFKRAYENTEQEFEQNAGIALKEVVKGILRFNNVYTLPVDPVKQIRNNYYAVMVNDKINSAVLEHYLQSEFKKFNIHQDFAYSIYDCSNRQLVYGGYVEGRDNLMLKSDKQVQPVNLPQWKADNYYFTVYFPHKVAGIAGQMSVWIYSSAILLVVVIFFSYSLFVILKQKRLSEIQRDFINNMAHEIRTPLSTITVSAQTLRNPDIIQNPQRLLNYSTIIMDEAVKLKNQVERVLSVADADSRLQLKAEEFNLHELIEQTAKRLVENNAHKKVSLQLDLQATHPVMHADLLHTGNMIANLIDNSMKYSSEKVDIIIASKSMGRNQVEMKFTDSGYGISKDNQKKIFDKFFRVPTGDVHNTKGFGIGLSYVSLIVKAMRGTISIKSELQKGTTFTITLPLG